MTKNSILFILVALMSLTACPNKRTLELAHHYQLLIVTKEEFKGWMLVEIGNENCEENTTLKLGKESTACTGLDPKYFQSINIMRENDHTFYDLHDKDPRKESIRIRKYHQFDSPDGKVKYLELCLGGETDCEGKSTITIPKPVK